MALTAALVHLNLQESDGVNLYKIKMGAYFFLNYGVITILPLTGESVG